MKLVRFVADYLKANLQVALEYRAAFWAQVFSMIVNDAMWLTFWALFFASFGTVRGYGFPDVAVLWAFVAFVVGVSTGVFGGCWDFARKIAQGELDFFLVLPKPVLLHLVVSSSIWSAWGDALFGLGVFCFVVRPAPPMVAAFLALSLASAAIFISYAIAVNSLAFWLGNASGLTGQLQSSLILFSTYPSQLFSGYVRLLLFTAIPAGFVAYVPVQLLHEWSWGLAGGLLTVAVVSAALATTVFYTGLRRYESGNLLAMRG